MISALSSALAEWLSKENVIPENDRSLFAYAVYSLLFGLLPILIALILGLFFDMVCEGIVLIVPFIIIRKFSGGKHVKSPVTCLILSSSLLAITFGAIQFTFNSGCVSILTISVLLSVLVICILSPVDSSERELTPRQARFFGTIARLLSVLFCGMYLLFITVNRLDIAIPLGMGILLPALLQLPCLLS